MDLLFQVIAIAIPVIYAITVHEVAHGLIAKGFGDLTASRQGRLTLNPIAHIDLVGTVILPAVLVYLGGLVFGWAKPVPVNPYNFQNRNRAMFFVALAGPVSNLIMAIIWSIVFMLYSSLSIQSLVTERLTELFAMMCWYGVFINLLLMFFNLLPIPPLDGGRVLRSVLSGKNGVLIDQFEPYGIFLVIGLLFFGILDPLFSLVQSLTRFML
ncbi:MAG: site-2 protease family protein [Gammaproteobacteria bacterium]|jgi:Zn-dependent protease|nr:site-2 protease family protein [Gammaproteobacteria bacterium]MBQ08254.1 site-2 protease family protein [Gammaproteobacteria bacterium]MDP6147409.1 site-2 protease family protein [Gammaproteobacteria bacterium]HJL80402.1 site-2 protease family protein [Gammaproteobacteria bacterium]HJM09313.1 site-2 protease family protein [Gammaproteobacteria bacterium]|tara:strand:- start:4667 stop:5302 length:636 start_codon:yes stop_codon:yes gene_type:complete